jgi:hypothetical protein
MVPSFLWALAESMNLVIDHLDQSLIEVWSLLVSIFSHGQAIIEALYVDLNVMKD